MKFIHFSDCHFDAPFVELGRLGNNVNIRRSEILQTFKDALDLAKTNSVDAVFISGDIFEHQYVNESTINYINNEFSKIPQIMIFISPGDHDPIIKNSYYSTYSWSPNVHIFNYFEKVYMPKVNTNVFGVGFNDYNENKCLIKDFIKEEGKINILVAHGTLDGDISITNNYNPIDKSYLKSLDFDYCALGHVHEPMINDKDGICYSGSIEPLGFNEPGEHGVIVGNITNDYKKIEFKAIAKRKYYTREVDVSSVKSSEDIIDEIKLILKFDNYKNDFIKIVLLGNIESTFFDRCVIEDYFKEYFYFCKVEDKTIIPYQYDEYERENNIKGIFVRRMRELTQKACIDDRKMLRMAMDYGLDALIKGQVKL